MAANLQSRGLVSLGKRVVNQISYASARTTANSTFLSARRGVQTSVYDKNPEDDVRDSVVPDEVIEPHSEKYWAPHPQSGVFGPAATDSAGRGFHSSPATAAAAESVLEEKAFFRPLEDLDKPDNP
ncbi:late embryogenesis abundant protein At5g17165 [Lycium ferocissimum]|uniref:late embryogenesis abundant protein At5g17165 n=1 Tax=Lycium ferocissimum TaxID=112874 RepID=UPI00281501B4|nr:late embryogenesis abundant protein At5g17165 [Lycium ferocissimum]